MAKTKHTTDNVVVFFRAGDWIGGKLKSLAKAWKVTHHEAGRRLMTLAMYRLTIDHHGAIERLEKATGGSHAFLRACDQVAAALDADASARRERMESPRTEQERIEFLDQWMQDNQDPTHGSPGNLKRPTKKGVYRRIRRQPDETDSSKKETGAKA